MEGVKIRYRNGYYAMPDQPAEQKDAARLLALAMQPSVPDSTRLLLKVAVLPPDAGRKSVSLGLAINPGGLLFTYRPGQRKRTVVGFLSAALATELEAPGVTARDVGRSRR